MNAVIKVGLTVLVGFVLLLPLGLIALASGATQQAEASCPITTPSPAVPTASAASVAPTAVAPSPSVAASAPATESACDGGDGLPDDGDGGIPPGFVFPSNFQQATAVAYALDQLGKPYVFGATGPNSFDCSGLVMKAWAAAGVTIPRTTYYQATTGVAVPNTASMEPGDLILIPGSDGTMAHPGHVGMYIGRDSSGRQWLVQAPHTGTVVHTTLVSSWEHDIAAIRRPLTHG